jgi:hypothetical protein
MKLVTFTQGGRTRIGAVEADEVVDFSASAAGLPQDMLSFLEHGLAALDKARAACATGRGRVALADVRLEAPILFNCFDIVEHLSNAFTLEPGDLIATGTPSGVMLGMDPRVWRKPGDVVRIAIDHLGALENPARPGDSASRPYHPETRPNTCALAW